MAVGQRDRANNSIGRNPVLLYNEVNHSLCVFEACLSYAQGRNVVSASCLYACGQMVQPHCNEAAVKVQIIIGPSPAGPISDL